MSIVSGIPASIAANLQFDAVPGGPSPWLIQRRPMGHWWGEIVSSRTRQIGNPGRAGRINVRQTYLVIIEGWYPKSAELNSDATWREMLDAVVLALEENRSLGLELVLEEGPRVVQDTEALKSSLHQGDQPTMCHYAKIAVRYSDEYEIQTVDS